MLILESTIRKLIYQSLLEVGPGIGMGNNSAVSYGGKTDLSGLRSPKESIESWVNVWASLSKEEKAFIAQFFGEIAISFTPAGIIIDGRDLWNSLTEFDKEHPYISSGVVLLSLAAFIPAAGELIKPLSKKLKNLKKANVDELKKAAQGTEFGKVKINITGNTSKLKKLKIKAINTIGKLQKARHIFKFAATGLFQRSTLYFLLSLAKGLGATKKALQPLIKLYKRIRTTRFQNISDDEMSAALVKTLKASNIDHNEYRILASKHFGLILNKNKKTLDIAAELNNTTPSELKKSIKEVEETCDAIFENAVFTGDFDQVLNPDKDITYPKYGLSDYDPKNIASGGRLSDLSPKYRKVVKDVTKDVMTGIINDGIVKESLQRFAKNYIDEITSTSAKEFKRIFGESATKKLIFSKSKQKINPYSIFHKASRHLDGKEFPLPSPPGGKIKYNFKKDFKKDLKAMGINPDSEEVKDHFLNYAKEMYKEGFKKISNTNLELVTQQLLENMKDVKFEFKTSYAGTFKLPGSSGTIGGFYDGQKKLIVIGVPKNLPDEKIFKKRLKETLRHEVEHALDHYLLTAISLGDGFVKHLLMKSPGFRLGSHPVMSDLILRRSKRSPLKLPSPISASNKEIGSLMKKFKQVKNPSRQWYFENVYKFLHENSTINPLEIDIFYTSSNKILGDEKALKRTLGNINYRVDSPEIFTRMLRFGEHAKKLGFNVKNRKSLEKFLKNRDNYESLKAYSRDTDGVLFNHLFRLYDESTGLIIPDDAKDRGVALIQTILGQNKKLRFNK